MEENIVKTKSNIVKIYTDGACSGNPGPGGYCAILFFKMEEKIVVGSSKITTNNKMELTAVVEGLKVLKKPCNVEVYSDSTYVVNAINLGWLKKWEKNNFIKSMKKIKKGDEEEIIINEIKNVELWKELLKYLRVHNVTFFKVKGHSDDINNIRCDKLAVEQIKKIKN